MKVTCEGCESKFQVDESKIRPTGSKVRCSKCRHVFTVYPPPAAEPEEELLLLEDEAPEEKEAETALAGIEARLDDLLGEKPAEAPEKPRARASAPALGEEGAGLNLDDLLAGIPRAEKQPAGQEAKAPDEGLELELDLDLPPAAPEEAPAATAAGGGAVLPSTDELELDLADLSFLDDGKKEEVGKEPTPEASPAEEGLDFDLAALLGEGGAGPAGEPAPAAAAGPAGKDAATPADADELDLSDLEAMLEGGGPAAADKTPAAATEGIDLELDLASEIGGKPAGGEPQELDLAAIVAPPAGEEKEPAGDKPAVKTEELDFSDLEAILEGEGPPAPKEEKPSPVGEPLGAGQGRPEQPAPEPLPADEETLDLEKLLAEDEDTSPLAPAGKAAKDEPEDLDLDLFLEPEAEKAGKKDEAEPDLVIEPLADDEEERPSPAATAGIAAAAAGAAGVLAAAKAKAESAPDGASTDPFAVPAAAAAGGATAVLDTAPAEEEEEVSEKKSRKKPRPRAGGFVKTLVYALLVLVVGGLAAIVVPRQLGFRVPLLSDIEIPFLAELEVPFLGKVFQAAPQDEAGSLRIRPLADTVQAEYVENASAGRLVVIRGQVRNEYDHPRSFIKVTAKLYDKNKNVVRAATVYAGNTLSAEDLGAKDMAAIAEQLKNQKGQQNRNLGVKPGAAVPFMVVFDRLPGNLEEYSVEAAGSTK